MLPKADDYDELVAGFRWSLPDHYNIGVDVCDRHATGLPRTALIIENEDGAVRRYSFHDLRELTNRLANLFGAQGLVRGDRVAVMLPQSLEVALTHIAAFKAGLISIPLFALFGEEALQYRLHNSGTRLLVTDRAGLEKLAVIRDRLPDLETVLCVEETNDALDFHGLLQEHSDAFTPVKLLSRN
jgi:acetyl-CoA synthetase